MPWAHSRCGAGHLPKRQVKDAPSIGPGSELPVGDEEAVVRHNDLSYQPPQPRVADLVAGTSAFSCRTMASGC